MKVKTKRFGEIEIDESKVIEFVGEVLGFPDSKRYVLIPHREGSVFLWLQSLDEPDVAFVVTSPKVFFPDYNPDIPEEALKVVGYEKGDVLDLLVILCLSDEVPTVNLLGPILINVTKKKALQLVLDPAKYEVAAPIPLKRPQNPSCFVSSAEAGDLTRAQCCR